MRDPDTPIDRRRSPSPPSGKPLLTRVLLALVGGGLALALSGALILLVAFALASDRLPSTETLQNYHPKMPLRIFTADGVLISEFGEERRSFVRIAEFPPLMTNAILAAEDARFFEHSGIDLLGILRAAVTNVLSGGREQGASTITQQVARNFFLSSEKTYTRKIYEILLALKIERSLSKEQILELYVNQIFLGKRAYGFAAAAQIYFGKTLAQLTPAEAAMLAGLPKAPSLYNPLVNPKRATERQQYILRRMLETGAITDEQYQAALKQELRYANAPGEKSAVRAPYVAEMARALAFELFREDAYTSGLNVYTTIDAADQRAASAAVRQGIVEYDRKYGYRGPESFIELAADAKQADNQIADKLDDVPDVEDYLAAVVLQASPAKVTVSRGHGTTLDISGEGLKFASGTFREQTPAHKRLRRGAVIRISQLKPGSWEIVQMPEVQGALVSCRTADGAVLALVGGFDFSRNKFNRVTQAWRQPGSSFKPFIYSAALEKGVTPATLVSDTPFSIDPALTGGQLWEPKNYDGKFEGPMRVRQALAKSKNMVSIRVLQSIGPQYAQDYVTRFGFEAERHPPYLTMALGAGSVTPWQMVAAYSVFANGGYRIDPYIVSKITTPDGKVLAQSRPVRAGNDAARAIDERNAFVMDSLLHEVVRSGTGAKALSLHRTDLAGKTGTTNDAHDAWFAGYQPDIAAVAWVGYDQPRKLGDRETGGGLALPIWISYMQTALRATPMRSLPAPAGVVESGGEVFFNEFQPGHGVASIGAGGETGRGTAR